MRLDKGQPHHRMSIGEYWGANFCRLVAHMRMRMRAHSPTVPLQVHFSSVCCAVVIRRMTGPGGVRKTHE